MCDFRTGWYFWKQTESSTPARSRRVCWFVFTPAFFPSLFSNLTSEGVIQNAQRDRVGIPSKCPFNSTVAVFSPQSPAQHYSFCSLSPWKMCQSSLLRATNHSNALHVHPFSSLLPRISPEIGCSRVLIRATFHPLFLCDLCRCLEEEGARRTEQTLTR